MTAVRTVWRYERAGISRSGDALCEHYVTVTQKLGIPYVFKALLTKPTAPPSTLIVDRAWKKDENLPGVEADFWRENYHRRYEPSQAQPVADVVDVIQLPAFLLARLTWLKPWRKPVR